jgi:hypothetical protein
MLSQLRDEVMTTLALDVKRPKKGATDKVLGTKYPGKGPGADPRKEFDMYAVLLEYGISACMPQLLERSSLTNIVRTHVPYPDMTANMHPAKHSNVLLHHRN